MKIKKILLSLVVILVGFNLVPKMHAAVDSTNRFEVEIRKGRFRCILGTIVKKEDRLRLLKEISGQSQNWQDKNVSELKIMLKNLAREDYYGKGLGVELNYIVTISDTTNEILENLKNLQEAYQKVCDNPEKFSLY